MDYYEIAFNAANVIIPSFLIYRQNQILKHANDLTAHTIGSDAPKESTRMDSLRRYWPMYGMLLMMLGTWTAIGINTYRKPANPLFSDWGTYPYAEIDNRIFTHETVRLDGRKFVDCIFDNVTFEFGGTAPFKFIPYPPRITGDVRIRSNDPTVEASFNAYMLAPCKPTSVENLPALP